MFAVAAIVIRARALRLNDARLVQLYLNMIERLLSSRALTAQNVALSGSIRDSALVIICLPSLKTLRGGTAADNGFGELWERHGDALAFVFCSNRGIFETLG